jgi:hypothetical protein
MHAYHATSAALASLAVPMLEVSRATSASRKTAACMPFNARSRLSLPEVYETIAPNTLPLK